MTVNAGAWRNCRRAPLRVCRGKSGRTRLLTSFAHPGAGDTAERHRDQHGGGQDQQCGRGDPAMVIPAAGFFDDGQAAHPQAVDLGGGLLGLGSSGGELLFTMFGAFAFGPDDRRDGGDDPGYRREGCRQRQVALRHQAPPLIYSPMAVLYPGAAWKPVPEFAYGGPMSQHLGLVLHVQEGNGDLQGWFSNPAAQGASSHRWVSKTGACSQYVDAALAAQAQSQGNGTYHSVETEGYTTEPLTDAQIDGLAGLYRWGHDTYGWPFATSDTVGQAGFAWHGMGGAAWGGHTGCPGDIRKNQRTQILQLAGGMVIPSYPAEDDMLSSYFANNQHHVYRENDDGTVVHWWLDTAARPPHWSQEKLPAAPASG